MRTAAYARYSSDNQRDASIEDQHRDNRALCVRQDWDAPISYQDEGISGTRRDRPGYMRLLADAAAGRFDVLVLWDLKRLSRAEDLPQVLARFKFWRVRVVTCDGYDSATEGSEYRGWLDGLIGSGYLRDLAKATHRGLKGRALLGASAGGLPYGYRVTETGQRAIDEAQAVVVRRIYAAYLSGMRARRIAAELNADRIPSPRGSTWAASAIHGDIRRGIGILANPIYCGRQIWNRSRWEKHPETGRRVRRERPRAEWIITEHPSLAIVTHADFDAVQRLLSGQSAATGTAGRPPRHLLSGILRCGSCGGPLAVIDAYRYGCANAKQRGTCAAPVRVPVCAAEDAIVGKLREALSGPGIFDRLKRAVAAEFKRQAPNAEDARRKLAEAERTRENVLRAIRAGILTASTKREMEAAENAVSDAQDALAGIGTHVRMLPDLKGRWARLLRDLGERGRSIPAARAALVSIVGSALTVREVDGALIAEGAIKLTMVAGAGSVQYLAEPLRIPIGPQPRRKG